MLYHEKTGHSVNSNNVELVWNIHSKQEQVKLWQGNSYRQEASYIPLETETETKN